MQKRKLDAGGQAGDQIKVTPEAVEAGAEAYLAWLDEDTVRQEPNRLEVLVRAILIAARQTCHPKPYTDRHH